MLVKLIETDKEEYFQQRKFYHRVQSVLKRI